MISIRLLPLCYEKKSGTLESEDLLEDPADDSADCLLLQSSRSAKCIEQELMGTEDTCSMCCDRGESTGLSSSPGCILKQSACSSAYGVPIPDWLDAP